MIHSVAFHSQIPCHAVLLQIFVDPNLHSNSMQNSKQTSDNSLIYKSVLQLYYKKENYLTVLKVGFWDGPCYRPYFSLFDKYPLHHPVTTALAIQSPNFKLNLLEMINWMGKTAQKITLRRETTLFTNTLDIQHLGHNRLLRH